MARGARSGARPSKLLEARVPSLACEHMVSENIGRWLLTEEGVVKGYLRVEDGLVAEICYGEAPEASRKAIVLPAFVNAHVHIGDAVAYPAPKGSVQEIVGPPDGYKHRMLRSVERSKKISAMRAAAELMLSTGTVAFADFREEGVDGVLAAKEALRKGSPRAIILGRPAEPEFTDEEASSLLELCDGFGVSAISDWPFEGLCRLADLAARRRKLFSMHVSECRREDIHAVLDLRPDFLVHMTCASDSDLIACAESGVPVVVCPRSNEFFGLLPDIPRLFRLGVEAALGTDNCMINRPDMLEEVKAAFRLAKAKGGISPFDAVRLATFGGRKVLNAKGKITTEISEQEDLVVIGVRGEDPLFALVTTACSGDIEAVALGGRIRRA